MQYDIIRLDVCFFKKNRKKYIDSGWFLTDMLLDRKKGHFLSEISESLATEFNESGAESYIC